MADRRSQRIREQLRQHPNPRIRATAEPLSLSDQMRRLYLPPNPAAPTTPDLHSQLARQLAQRRSRR